MVSGITMCVGKQSEEVYRRMREVGASQLFLLRIENNQYRFIPIRLHPRDELHSLSRRA